MLYTRRARSWFSRGVSGEHGVCSHAENAESAAAFRAVAGCRLLHASEPRRSSARRSFRENAAARLCRGRHSSFAGLPDARQGLS